MSKVKINPKYPNNPGLLEGKYWLFVDNKLDFMDDPNAFPTKAQLRFNPSTLGFHNLDTIYGKLRQARDQYRYYSNELFYAHLNNFRMTGDAYPKVFKNVSLDLTIPSSDNYYNETTPAHEMTRFVFPSRVDGSNNFPVLKLEGAEMACWDNPTVPKHAVKLLSKVDNWSIESLVNRADYQSGGDLGSGVINLPLSHAMSYPFLGATISWPIQEQYYNGNQWTFRTIEYVWGSNHKQQFSFVPDNEVDANGLHIGQGAYVEDGTGVVLNYQDMWTFYRTVRDEFAKFGNEIALARTARQELHNIDGDDANLNAAIAALGLTELQAQIDAKQAEKISLEEQLNFMVNSIDRSTIDTLNAELNQLYSENADQSLIDAKQAEIVAEQAQIDADQAAIDVKAAEVNLAQEQIDALNVQLNALESDSASLIAQMRTQNEMIKAYSLMKAWFLSDPMPKINMARCTINGVESPVLKNGFANSYIVNNMRNSQYITQEEYNELQQNPVTPLEYFGEINLRYVPAVKYVDELKGIEGQLGDMIFVEEIGQKMAFDGVNWTEKQHNIYDDSLLGSARGTQDAKFKSFNELTLAMKPFLWSAHHIPAYMITANGEMRTPADRTVFDFTPFNGTASTPNDGTTPQ